MEISVFNNFKRQITFGSVTFIFTISPSCTEPPEVLYSKVIVTVFYPLDIAFVTSDPGHIIINGSKLKELTNKRQIVCISDLKTLHISKLG